MDGWKTTFLLGNHLFRCYVSFREGIYAMFAMLAFSSSRTPRCKYHKVDWSQAPKLSTWECPGRETVATTLPESLNSWQWTDGRLVDDPLKCFLLEVYFRPILSGTWKLWVLEEGSWKATGETWFPGNCHPSGRHIRPEVSRFSNMKSMYIYIFLRMQYYTCFV